MPSRPKFPEWTPIAARERDSENVWCKIVYTPYPDAPITPQEARVLSRTGQLLVANRHTDEFVFLVVKTPSAVRR